MTGGWETPRRLETQSKKTGLMQGKAFMFWRLVATVTLGLPHRDFHEIVETASSPNREPFWRVALSTRIRAPEGHGRQRAATIAMASGNAQVEMIFTVSDEVVLRSRNQPKVTGVLNSSPPSLATTLLLGRSSAFCTEP